MYLYKRCRKKHLQQENFERIYEISRLFGLGFEVFDTLEDLKKGSDESSP